jgi:hypothetical protein
MRAITGVVAALLLTVVPLSSATARVYDIVHINNAGAYFVSWTDECDSDQLYITEADGGHGPSYFVWVDLQIWHESCEEPGVQQDYMQETFGLGPDEYGIDPLASAWIHTSVELTNGRTFDLDLAWIAIGRPTTRIDFDGNSRVREVPAQLIGSVGDGWEIIDMADLVQSDLSIATVQFK